MTEKEVKKCRTCKKCKVLEEDYYFSKGKYKNDCKKCFIKKRSVYQKINRTWNNIEIDKDKRRLYMQEYRKSKPEVVQKATEKFLSKNPDYHAKKYREKLNSPFEKE